MDPIPLSPEDRAILELEGIAVAGHTCKVVRLAPGAPDHPALLDSITARIEAVPSLTWRLSDADEPAWIEAEDFTVDDHVVASPAGPLDEPALRARTAEVFASRLDRSRPLWHLEHVETAEGGAALIWRIHHSIADGTTAMHMAEALLWDDGPPPADHPARHGTDAHAADQRRRRGHIAGFIGREWRASHRRSPFDGAIGQARQVAFARVPLAATHDAAKKLAGATLNDAVLACVAGALRAWLLACGSRPGEIRVRVPVSLHEQAGDTANRDSWFALGLPLEEPDPIRRLELVTARTRARKQHHDAERIDDVLREAARLSPRLRSLCEDYEGSPRAFALSISNVPGPRRGVSVLGAPVDELYSLAEIGRRHALRIAVISIGDTLAFGLCADPGLVEGLDEIAAGIEAEAALLIAAADVGQPDGSAR